MGRVRTLIGRVVVALCGAAALGLSLAPRGATACSCGGPHLPMLRPAWPESSGLKLASESIDVDCDRPDSCAVRWVMTYTRSAAGEPARVPMAIPFSTREEVSVSFSGGAAWGVRGELRDEAENALVATHEVPYSARALRSVQLVWIEDEGAARSAELVIEGRTRLPSHGEGVGRYARQCCHFSALEVRHPVVPTYSHFAAWSWGEVHAPAVRVDARTRVRVRPPAKYELEEEDTLAREEADGGEAIVLEGPSDPGARLTLSRPRRLKGGPFVAFGGAILDAPNHGRGRLGWEHTFGVPFVLYSAAVETDFIREVTVVPAVEVSHGRSYVLFFLPCAGLGVGAPLQLLPELRAGVRVQASLAWRVFTFLTTFDYLPPPRAGGPEAAPLRRLAFLGQLSF